MTERRNPPPERPTPSPPQAPIIPYVGIAGFTSVHEVRSIAADLYTMNPYGTPESGGRRLAVGVLASWKTLNGLPAGNPERYPRIEDVRALLDAAVEPIRHCSPGLGQKEGDGTTLEIRDRTLRLIHYNSREPDLPAQVARLSEAAGPNLDGFQLNVVWPKSEEIRDIAQEYPTLRLVLQINREMFSNVGRKAQLLIGELQSKYFPYVTDFLFDMSGGTGAAIDLEEAASVLEALYASFGGVEKGGVGIGVAGGLDYKNVYGLKPLFDRWPDLSIDAEGRVRDSYVNAKKETVTWLNEGAREFARRALWPFQGRTSRTQTTP
ncbi:MAG TPA: hypothetical protein VL283_01650 [Candidatus Baltobacteraceae bacterium]|nr:hypothetical protein [Candidatus Baltobacteraceae bacterium]